MLLSVFVEARVAGVRKRDGRGESGASAGADAGVKRGESEQRGELIIRSRVVRCHPTGSVE